VAGGSQGLPPRAVKTIRELIYWEYAKLAAEIAVGDRKNYGYVMATYERYKRNRMHPLAITHQIGLESKGSGECAFCRSADELTTDFVFPLLLGGPDRVDNQIPICARCKSSKGGMDLLHWYGKERRYEIPRLVFAKFLKLAYEVHEGAGTLDSHGLDKDLDVYDLAAIPAKK
jgi:hypothetical protein